MESLKSQSEQCIFILTTKFENSAQLQYLSNNIRKCLFEKKSFPVLLNHEIRSIPKIANSQGTLNKIIHKIPFPIDYNRKFLEDEILSNPTLIQKARDYISLLILHFYISFFQTYEHDIDDIVAILKSLLLIILNRVSNNEKYQIYAISSFVTIILDKKFDIDYSDSRFLSCISDFFSLPIIPQESLLVLQYMVEKIGNSMNKDEELSNVLQIVNYSFQKYRPLFTNQFISTIFLNLRFQLINLNYIVLSFFSQLSEILNEQDTEMYIKAFPAAFIPYYDKCLQKKDNKMTNTKINFYETYSQVNPESIKITLPISFEENPPPLGLNILDLKSIKCEVFNVLMKIIKSKPKKFTNIFIEQVIKTLQLQNIIKYYELLAIYIHLLIQLSPISNEYLENTRFLFEEPYFKAPFYQQDSTSNKPTYYLNPHVSSIRFLIVNFLFRQEFTFIQSIFHSMLKRNSILPEFCYRSLYADEEFRHPELGSLLFELYSMQINSNTEEGKASCLITLKNYINTVKLRISFFDNTSIYKYVFSFININKERRQFILDFITKYFDTCKEMLNSSFIDTMVRTFNNNCDDCAANMIEQNLSFILDVIKFSTHVMQVNNLLIENFESFFDKICFLLTKLPQNDPLSKLIFTHSFSLFSVHHITQNESNAIETSAISLFGLTPNLKQLILSLMGSENGIQDEFIITQPQAILLLVRLFKDDRTIWPFLANLCKFSPINSIYCHEVGVDSIILEQLFQYKVANDLKNEESTENKNEESTENKNEENVEKDLNQKDDEKIDDLLTLFYRISKFSSSINIVNRYMSLLCNDPVNNRVSDYHMKFVKLINALAQETQKIPMTAFYEPQEFSNVGIVCNWTVTIWIFVTDRLKCPLISISKGIFSYEISIENQNINLNVNKSQTDNQFDGKIPLYDWVCLTFKVDPQNTTLFINGEKQSTISHQSFYISTANITFNASQNLLLGGITIYNTIIEENLYSQGPRKIWKNQKNTLVLAVRPHVHNNQLETVIFSSETQRIQKEFKKAFSIMNFIDILCERCGVTLILPLMAQIKMQNADPELLSETLSIIKNLLLNRSNSQKKFREMNGFRIISHLLTCCYTSDSADKPNLEQTDLLNYKIYSKLFEMYSILEEEKSRQLFLKYILVNLMIWVHCYPEDVVKIMSFLASQNKETFWKYYKLNYSLTISAFRVYFSLNSYQNVPKFKGTEKEMDQVRQDLITFSRDFCDEKILNSDFLIVISHLKYTAELSKEIDLFKYLEEIINTDFQTTKNIKPESKLMICYLLRKCIKTTVDSSRPPLIPHHHSRVKYKISPDFNLLIEVIKLFYNSIYQCFSDNNQYFTIEMTNNRGNRNIYKKDMAYYLMRWISDSLIDSSFLKLLIPLINENYPLLFPLGAMISISLNEENFNNFLQQIKLNPKVTEIDDIWYLWIIIGIFEFKLKRREDDEDEINQGIEFLLNNSPITQLLNIFLMIINLSLYKQYSETNVVILFLRSLSRRIDNEEKCSIFIKLAMYQIYLRKYQMKLNKNQTKTVKYSITDDDENDNGKTFTEKIHDNQLNFPKIRSSAGIQNNQADKQISRRLSNFTSKDSYSRFVAPSNYPNDIENHVDTIDPKKNKKISMKTVDDLTDIMKRNVADYKCIQEVKLNEKYNWLDTGLVNQIVSAFLSFPNQESIDDVIIAEAYRLKYAEDKVLNKYVISAIEQEKLSERYSISYFNKICKKVNIESPFKQGIIESHLMNEYRQKKVELLNCMKNIYDIVSKPVKNTKRIFKYYADDLAESTHVMFKQTIHDYLASVGLRMTKSKNKWSHLCVTMMQGPEAPWHSSIKHEKTHYKRDFSSCFCFCPFKLKINKKYDQHLFASFKRNTGSQKTAEELYDKFLQKLKEKENHNTYFDLHGSELGEEVDEEKPKIETDISQYIFKQDCQIIKISKEIDACFMLSKDSIVIQTETKVKKYPLYLIDLILLRDYLHQATAIEIFIKNGTTILLNFNEPNEFIATEIQCQVIQNNDCLIEVQQSSNEIYFKSKKITQMWCENKISNFEYLILLNIYSGRTFNNASQYPFLPWIIFDYESKKIEPVKIRELDKPIGAINPERLNKLIENYEEKKNEGYTPFLYSSGPMCPLAIYYWLVRVEPFTTFHIEMQDGSFDHSDRVFKSWQKAKELITTMDDMYRELPPEAFFSHDFLVNYNEISLGITPKNTKQGNEKENIDPNSVENFDPSSQDVLLPPWASSPIEFIYINRKVLESEIVTNHLHSWIDLVWGYKQRGQEAEKAYNVFRPEMYHDIWSTKEGKNEDNRPVIETYLSQVGQIPVQLFTTPHPKKKIQTPSRMSMRLDNMKIVKNDSDNSDFIHVANDHYFSFFNLKDLPHIKIRVDEIKNFVGAQISIQRTSSNEAQLSLNYLLLKNKINISGLTEDGEIMNIKVGYKLNYSEDPNLTQKNKAQKNSRFGKNVRCKTKENQSPIISKDNVTYNTDVTKKRYSLTSDIKKKKSSLLTQKFIMKFAFLDESKICYSDNVQNTLIFDDLDLRNETELLINQNKITALAFDGDLTIAAFDSDGFLSIIQIFKSGNDPVLFSLECIYTTPSFYERINCCDISKIFHQVVCGSSDGFILIFSLSNQTFLRTIKLDDGKSPQFINITKSWGFIFAVLTEISDAKKKTFLAVWTINGDFIKMKEIDFEITKITTWRSKSGFDYYLFATVESNIIAGEVFTLENFFESNIGNEIIELGYDYDLENAIVLSKDGMISFIPCSAPPFEF